MFDVAMEENNQTCRPQCSAVLAVVLQVYEQNVFNTFCITLIRTASYSSVAKNRAIVGRRIRMWVISRRNLPLCLECKRVRTNTTLLAKWRYGGGWLWLAWAEQKGDRFLTKTARLPPSPYRLVYAVHDRPVRAVHPAPATGLALAPRVNNARA